ncbi:MAG: deoxyribose-phosphate aldolase [Clostridia bacterium]|nr:deoxyribose-phosphate aldolase [Clostridia bacterium]
MPFTHINQYIEHTLLKPQSTEREIIELCREAKEYGFYAVCVNPWFVNLAAKLLTGTKVKVVGVVGFPLGATLKEVKALEAEQVFKKGAHEVDMVMNIGALKGGNYEEVVQDIQAVVDVAKNQVPKKVVKVIIETGLLTHEEKIKACQLVIAAGGDFVKTCTGFNGGAALEDIEIIKQATEGKVKIKASGGIKDFKTAQAMLEAGADRLGTSSGVAIIKSIG